MKALIAFTLVMFICSISVAKVNHVASLQLQHDVSAYSAGIQGNLSCIAIQVPIGIAYTFRNFGASDETNVKVFVLALDLKGEVIYRDSGIVADFPSGTEKSMSFHNFIKEETGRVNFYAYTNLENDEDRGNDTICTRIVMVFGTDLQAVAVVYPPEDTVLPSLTEFNPVGCFLNTGATDVFDGQVRTNIMRCSDDALVFRSDTTVESLYIDSLPVTIPFPRKQGIYDMNNLQPGCYKIAVICRKSDDGDRSNDTSYSYFNLSQTHFDHNIAGIWINSPNSQISLNSINPVRVRFKNTGGNSESAVKISVTIRDKQKNAIIYQDSRSINNWASGSEQDVDFKTFTTSSIGLYSLVAASSVDNDQYHKDDTLKSEFNVGNPCEVEAAQVSFPAPDEAILQGTNFIPIGLFRWKGSENTGSNIPVRMDIRRCKDKALIFRADSAIPVLDQSTFFLFPSHTSEGSLSDLTPGCYSIAMYSRHSCDMNHANDTVYSAFSIHVADDIAVESIVSPKGGTYVLKDSLLPVVCRFNNNGMNDEVFITSELTIKEPSGKLYHDSVKFDLQRARDRDIAFHSFTPKSYGEYQYTITSKLASDKVHGNDTLFGSFISIGKADVEVTSISYPGPDAILPVGTSFEPVGIFKGLFNDANFYDVPVRCQIRNCGDNRIVFISNALIPELMQNSQEMTFSFPSQQGNYDTRSLIAGCYKLEIIAMYAGDENRTDDTASISFSVSSLSTPYTNSVTNNYIILDQNYPNPFTSTTTISYSLPERGKASIRILDITGRTMQTNSPNEFQEAGKHSMNLDLRNLPDGVYIYELVFTDNNSETKRLSRRMTLMK